MKSKKPNLKELASLCAEIGPEDGIHPRESSKAIAPARSKPRYKDYQLCKQVERAINVELADDVALLDLMVARVELAPDSMHLLVIVVPCSASIQVDEMAVSAALSRSASRLRSAVATSIHRKRTPELSFRFLPAAPNDAEIEGDCR